MPSPRGSCASKFAGGFGLFLALTLCLCHGSTGSNLESVFAVKKLRGFDAAEVLKLVKYNGREHGRSRRLRNIKPRILMENCTKNELLSVKSDLIHSSNETEKDIRKLLRISFWSFTCRLELKKAVQRIQKAAVLSIENDFGRAWRQMSRAIAEVETCGASLNQSVPYMGEYELRKVFASLNQMSTLIIKCRACYHAIGSENPPAKLSPPSIMVPALASDADNGSEPSLSPDSSNGFNDSYGDDYFNGSAPSLSPDSYSNWLNESYGEDFFNGSAPSLSPDSYSNWFNDSYSGDFLNGLAPSLFPDSYSNGFNDSNGDDYFNGSAPSLSPDSYSNLFNDSYGEDFFNGSAPSPIPI